MQNVSLGRRFLLEVASIPSRFKIPTLPFAGFAVLMLVTFVFAYRNILRFTLVGYGDTGPFLTPDNALSQFLYAWSPYSLGHFENQPSWIFMQYIMGTLFGNLGQYILLLSLGPLSGVFQYIFLGQFKLGTIPRYGASFIYAMNVWVIGEYQGGGFSIVLVYAMIPIVAFFTLRFLREMNVTNFFLFCMSSGLTYFAHPHALVMIAPVVLTFWIVEVWRRRNLRYLISTLIAGGLWAVVTLLLYLPYYGNLNIFGQLFSTAFAPANSGGVTLNLSLADFAWTYRNAIGLTPSFLSISNLIGFHEILIPLAFVSVLFADRSRRGYAIGFSFLIAGILLFIYYTALQLTYSLFLRFTILNIFENPVKLIAILLFATSLLVSFSLDEILRRLPSLLRRTHLALLSLLPFEWRHSLTRKYRSPGWTHVFQTRRHPSSEQGPFSPAWKKHLVPSLTALVLIAIILIPLYGTLAAGDMGLISGYHGDSFATPSSFYEVRNWLDTRHNQEGFFRTLWLPQGPETFTPSLSMDPWSFALQGASIRYGAGSLGFVHTVLSHLAANDTDNIAELIGVGGVKYVIIDLNHSTQTGDPRVAQYSGAYIAIGDPMRFVGFLSRQAGLSRIYTNDLVIDENFVIFENRLFVPHLSLYSEDPISNITGTFQWMNDTNNLVANPSFENGLADWNIYTSSEVTADSQHTHSPNYSAQMNNTRGPGGGWSILSQTLPVVGGGTYNISLWLKTDFVDSTHVKLIYYSNYNATSEAQAISEQGLTSPIYGTNDWFEVSYVGQTPTSAVRMDLVAAGGWSLANNSSGLTWVDDVAVYRGHYHVSIPSVSANVPGALKLSETQYNVDLPPHGPMFLVLHESYDPNWAAIISGVAEPSFLALGWANGFVIPASSSESTVTVIFQLQSTRTLAIQAWALVWIVLAGVAIAGKVLENRVRQRLPPKRVSPTLVVKNPETVRNSLIELRRRLRGNLRTLLSWIRHGQ